MHSLVSIIGVVLSGKDDWSEWYRRLKHTLIFNDFWITVCDGDTPPTKLMDVKELANRNMKNCKGYALIATSLNEEVNHHIYSIENAWNTLKKL